MILLKWVKFTLNDSFLAGVPILSALWRKLKSKRAALAFSGGKDSLALLHYLYTRKDSLGLELLAFHVNHHLRGAESDRDEGFCAAFCRERSIPFKALHITVANTPLAKARGLEHAARVLRYEALEKERVNTRCDYLLTAHTLSDSVESFFVDLITGASVFTLGGIAEAKGALLRPFLNVTSEMVREYLSKHGLTPVFDNSNDNERYVRNFVRKRLIPLLPQGTEEKILKAQRASAALSKIYAKNVEGIAQEEKGIILFDRTRFDALSALARSYLLATILNSLFRAGKAHIEEIEKVLKKKSPSLSIYQRAICARRGGNGFSYTIAAV